MQSRKLHMQYNTNTLQLTNDIRVLRVIYTKKLQVKFDGSFDAKGGPGSFLMRAYCACLGMTVNSTLVRNLAVIELTARLGADINQ